jgi:type IV pilus assembly protein PilM
MARRLIGLDVGTNAVTIAEVTPGNPPRLDMFAQVALPREAMREGEVADEAAVANAVERLRTEVGLKKVAVRVGIASPRVVVRQVEMPLMTRDELSSALQFQAGELIPIPIDEAVIDFAILGDGRGRGTDGGEPTMQVLLAAAYESTVARLVSAIEAGGLTVAAVDLIPLALTRALARPRSVLASVGAAGAELAEEEIGAEGIVSFGGGVTAIAVHEGGVPRFVRVISSGGRELTDAIATDLDVPSETAEALKRQLSMPGNDEVVARARGAIDRPLSVLLDEVRSSIDYYRNQPGSARLTRVVTTGGSSQLPGLPERLSALVGVPVEPASLRDVIRIGDIGFAPDELPRLEPYLPAPIGLALGGFGVGTVVDLTPRTRRKSSRSLPAVNPKVAAIVGAAVIIIGGATYVANGSASSAKKHQADAETEVKKVQAQLARLTAGPSAAGHAAVLQSDLASALGSDVGWPKMLGGVNGALPPGVWLTTFQGQLTVPAPPAAGAKGAATGISSARNTAAATSAQQTSLSRSAGSATPGGAAGARSAGASATSATCEISGNVTMSGVAKDFPSVAAFLDALASDDDVTTVWLASASKQGDTLSFTINAELASGARSDRITQFVKGATCK